MKYREAILNSHQNIMMNERAIILGQGITDFKAMWGTLDGLNELYPDRMIETPIAEDSIAGICVGLSLNGMYPINTHIRADFGLLIFNQLINLIAKYRYMFGGSFELPMLIRLVIGRSWGQGAQHSQSLQSLLSHIPGLTVIMPSNSSSLAASYEYAFNHYKNPVISFEHRLLYELDFDMSENICKESPLKSYIARHGSHVTVIATSVMVLECLRAADYLKDFGIELEVIDLHNTSFPDKDLIIESLKKTGLLIVADTSWLDYGVSAEVSRIICEFNPALLKKNQINLGMADASCPTAKALEDIFYPGVSDIIEKVLMLLDKQSIPIPEKQSMTDFYKHFKGPF